jgi:hypothetical protein
LLYATRNTAGLWSSAQVVDAAGKVGAQPTIAVDHTGKAAIGYYDLTNTGVKFALYNGTKWSTQMIESNKLVGTSPSLAFDIDGNAYLAYYRRTGGNLRLATLHRDAGTWTRITVDGANADVGADLSLDVAEAPVASDFGFTVYDTTVAIAYADNTNGDLKYARLDLDKPSATWFVAVVDDTTGVARIDLDLHTGPLGTVQAQIAFQDHTSLDVKYAYRNTTWFVENVADSPTARLGDSVQLFFDSNDTPEVVYYNKSQKALYTAVRTDHGTTAPGTWTSHRTATGYGTMAVSLNERTGDALLSWLNRPRTNVSTKELL